MKVTITDFEVIETDGAIVREKVSDLIDASGVDYVASGEIVKSYDVCFCALTYEARFDSWHWTGIPT